MAVEQYTENLTLKEMKCSIGKNDFGYVFPQGDVSAIDKIENLLISIFFYSILIC